MSKKSIRFFNDREVRAVWDEERRQRSMPTMPSLIYSFECQ